MQAAGFQCRSCRAHRPRHRPHRIAKAPCGRHRRLPRARILRKIQGVPGACVLRLRRWRRHVSRPRSAFKPTGLRQNAVDLSDFAARWVPIGQRHTHQQTQPGQAEGRLWQRLGVRLAGGGIDVQTWQALIVSGVRGLTPQIKARRSIGPYSQRGDDKKRNSKRARNCCSSASGRVIAFGR